jgi:uncharacterized protein YbjT (DUF2867 family)
VIVVTGATGTNGRHLIAELLERGAEVRAVVRDDSARRGVDARADVMVGDLDHADQLGHVLDGAQALFVLTANGPRQVQQEKDLIDAAVRSGVPRIVKFSANGAGSSNPDPIAVLHRQMERHLEASGIEFTILRNNFFMQNLLWFAKAIAGQHRIRLPMGDGAVAMVDARDIARVAAAALIEPGHAGAIYDVTGPEALTMHDVAAVVSQALGLPIRYEAIDGPGFRVGLDGWGLDAAFAQALVETYVRLASGTQREVTGTVQRIGGHAPRTLKHFIDDHAAAFKPSLAGG